jgi:hypothetical protein
MARGKQDRDFTPRILSTPDDAQIVDINTIKAHPPTHGKATLARSSKA